MKSLGAQSSHARQRLGYVTEYHRYCKFYVIKGLRFLYRLSLYYYSLIKNTVSSRNDKPRNWNLLVWFLFIYREGGCSPFAVSLIGDYFPATMRATALGFYNLGIYVGYSLAFALGTAISAALVRMNSKHYDDVTMGAIASQITGLGIVYSAVYSDADQRKHESSASLAFVWGIHRDRWIPRTKGQLRGKCFHLMMSSWIHMLSGLVIIRSGIEWYSALPISRGHVFPK